MPLGLVAILCFTYNVLLVYSVGVIGYSENVTYWSHIIGFIIGIQFEIAWNHGKWRKKSTDSSSLADHVLYPDYSTRLFVENTFALVTI
jgi:hypothetical protein